MQIQVDYFVDCLVVIQEVSGIALSPEYHECAWSKHLRFGGVFYF